VLLRLTVRLLMVWKFSRVERRRRAVPYKFVSKALCFAGPRLVSSSWSALERLSLLCVLRRPWAAC
jgi:hypothetical protein